MQNNYNLTYNPNFNTEMQLSDLQSNYYKYDYNYYNTPPPSFQNLDPRLNYVTQTTLSLRPEEVETEQKTDDELYIETWLSKIGKIQINLDSTIEIIPSGKKTNKCQRNPMKISETKLSLRKSMILNKKLEDAYENLSSNFSSLSTTEWKNKINEIGKLKDELTSSMAQFENVSTFSVLRSAVKKRKKKRVNQRKRKVELRKQATVEKENREKMHKDIDQWLENMKDAVERAKMEENMQKDADCVLAEVTKKKADSRKQLSLIAVLIKLRNVRENLAIQRGEKISLEDRSAFNKITEKLTNMWEDTSKIYSKEEQGLRIMLEKNATEDSYNLRVSKEEKIINQWQYILFGPKCIPSPVYCGLTSAEKDLNTFIAIRRSWDTFLVGNDDPSGSKVPIGWVLPSIDASADWTKYLNG